MDGQDQKPDRTQRLVIVTGPSGAGRSTAINILEDFGFEAIDNMPISLLKRLIEHPGSERPLAIGLDVRNRDFSLERFQDLLDWLQGLRRVDSQILYLDSSEDALVRRYSETRRRHPLSPEAAAIVGIREESELLGSVRDQADILIDTSDLTPHDLKASLKEWFFQGAKSAMGITVHSFSYKKGLPKGLDMVFDCRFLRNPYWDQSLRGKSGLDPEVQAYIAADERYAGFVSRLRDLLIELLPAFQEEGKSHLSIGFGCTGGQHRSVAVAETIANGLAETGWQVSKRHRERDRWASS